MHIILAYNSSHIVRNYANKEIQAKHTHNKLSTSTNYLTKSPTREFIRNLIARHSRIIRLWFLVGHVLQEHFSNASYTLSLVAREHVIALQFLRG